LSKQRVLTPISDTNKVIVTQGDTGSEHANAWFFSFVPSPTIPTMKGIQRVDQELFVFCWHSLELFQRCATEWANEF